MQAQPLATREIPQRPRPPERPRSPGGARPSERGRPPERAQVAERGSFVAPAGGTLAAALRAQLPGSTWNDVRRLCASGKVTVAGAVETEPARRLTGGEEVAWRLSARDPRRAARPDFRIVHEDAHLVVVDKPEGVASVPYERKDTGT